MTKKRGTPEERFWAKVKKTDGCWIWIGHTTRKARGLYGLLQTGTRVKSRVVRAHRFSWELVHGPIPEGLIVCHRCDVGLCVNPDHLFLGTAKDNYLDAMMKGRHSHGERHGNSVLTDDQVRRMREDRACGMTVEALRCKYGLASKSSVKDIVKRKFWKHVQ